MKCRYCGADLQEGIFFCPSCGKEVQWVPEYNTLESLMRKKKAAEAEKLKKELEAQKERARIRKQEEMARQAKRKKRWFLLSASAAVVAAFAGGIFYVHQKQNNSFDFQMAQAETKFSNKDYEEAMKYVERALTLLPENPEANILEAKLYFIKGNEEAAESILTSVIERSPENVSAYGELLRFYEQEEETEKIQQLMANAEDSIRASYQQYVCQLPEVSLKGGEFTQEQELSFSDIPEGTHVYYTLDNSEPDSTSISYDGDPIVLVKEGKTTLKYIAYNELGIASEVGVQVYQLTYPIPDPPSITPSSGRYTPDMTIQVTAPDGCEIYYAFDSTPTPESEKYTEPVSIPYGEHIFMAIAVNAQGKISRTVSEAYVNYGW